MSSLALLQLLRLASPALPIGAYSYSQGLESAIEHGWVHDAASAGAWLADSLDGPLARYEWPMLAAALAAAEADDATSLAELNIEWLASRESAELRAETEQTGYSLKQLLLALPETSAPLQACLQGLHPLGLPVAYAVAATVLGVKPEQALSAYAWSWLENQIMVLMKALPLGQTAGQQLFSALLPRLSEVLQSLPAQPLSGFAPGLAWLSMRHETQYSRLFRS
jgi:urease accessory protein